MNLNSRMWLLTTTLNSTVLDYGISTNPTFFLHQCFSAPHSIICYFEINRLKLFLNENIFTMLFQIMFNQLCLVPRLPWRFFINSTTWYMLFKSPFCTFYSLASFTVTFIIEVITPSTGEIKLSKNVAFCSLYCAN